MYTIVVVRYGEIFLKSEFVKRQLENNLVENIRFRLSRDNLLGKIIRKRHRIYIKTVNAVEVAESLKNVFGIVSVSPAVEAEAGMEDICETGLRLAEKVVDEGGKFAVRVKRTGEHSFSSMDVERVLGSKILEKLNAHVNLDNPEKTIFVEISGKNAFVFDRKIKCVGGLPYKTQGKVIALISSGIDSPVAAWMMMHRGCEIVALHFGTDKDVKDGLERLEEYSGYRIKCYVIPHQKILQKIFGDAGRYTCIICKRTMLRIAEKVMEAENAHGIVTGDSLGQVASQTLENLKVISEITYPLYRPLIGMDKNEIIEIARRIGTYNLSRETGCEFVPKNPCTRAMLDEIRKLEEKIGLEEIIESVDIKCLER